MNGHPCPKTTYARLSGYVEQSDIHSEKATVHESLIFSAALRMPRNVPRRVRMAFVEEVRSYVSSSPPTTVACGISCYLPCLQASLLLNMEVSVRPAAQDLSCPNKTEST